MVKFPLLNELGEVIQTAEQGKGRVRHEGLFRLREWQGYRIRLWPIGEQPLPPLHTLGRGNNSHQQASHNSTSPAGTTTLCSPYPEPGLRQDLEGWFPVGTNLSSLRNLRSPRRQERLVSKTGLPASGCETSTHLIQGVLFCAS